MSKHANRRMAWCLGALLGCFSWSLAVAGEQGHGHEEEQGHKAAHGGVLNVIEECAIGHVEVVVEGETLKAWFVGGDGATTTAARLEAKEIPLLVTADGGATVRPLTLTAAPLALAEEKVGDCSHFTATAPWLKEAKTFVAVGVAKYKGTLRVLRIEYPKGFDPDHEHAHDDGHDEDHDDEDHDDHK